MNIIEPCSCGAIRNCNKIKRTPTTRKTLAADVARMRLAGAKKVYVVLKGDRVLQLEEALKELNITNEN